jgi:hypothetical protein
LDFGVDTFKALLMRASFSFSSVNHAALKNVKTNTGAIAYYVTAATKTFTRASGSFVTDGFVVGNYISTNGTNVGVYVVRAVTALTMRVDLVGAATLVDEGTVGAPVTFTITSEDEYATADGYTRGGLTVTFALTGSTLTLVTSSFDWGDFGSAALLLSPGVIIYDDTSSADDIVAYAKLSPWTVSF